MIENILTIVGLTLIITTSGITKPIREFATKKSKFFGELLSCNTCSGFWVGLIIFYLPDSINSALYYMAIGSMCSQLMYLIMQRLKIR